MNRNEALTRAYGEQLTDYILAGATFALIQYLDNKFRDKYKNKGFVVFLIQLSKGVIPLTLLSIILGGSSSSLGESIGVWLVVVITIYIFVSPFYLVYWLYKRFIKKT